MPLDRRRTATFAGCAAVVVALGIGYGAWVAVAGPQHITGPAQPATAIAGETVDPLGLVVPTIDQHFTFGHAAARRLARRACGRRIGPSSSTHP